MAVARGVGTRKAGVIVSLLVAVHDWREVVDVM